MTQKKINAILRLYLHELNEPEDRAVKEIRYVKGQISSLQRKLTMLQDQLKNRRQTKRELKKYLSQYD